MEAVESFTATLVGDVIAARETLSASDTQVNRRNLVRASMAAVEGLVWLCRQHVRDTARHMDELTPLADMALREQSYTVTTNGEVVEVTRFIPLTSSIRLIARQAAHLGPGPAVDFPAIDFDDEGWSRLRTAIEIRNRITHPKTLSDLDASDNDLEMVGRGFEWLLATATQILAGAVAAFAHHTKILREILDALKRGEPDMLNLYQVEFSKRDQPPHFMPNA